MLVTVACVVFTACELQPFRKEHVNCQHFSTEFYSIEISSGWKSERPVLQRLSCMYTECGWLVAVGWKLGEHGDWSKCTNWEMDARVPFIIRAPWIAASVGQKTPAIVELVDVSLSVRRILLDKEGSKRITDSTRRNPLRYNSPRTTHNRMYPDNLKKAHPTGLDIVKNSILCWKCSAIYTSLLRVWVDKLHEWSDLRKVSIAEWDTQHPCVLFENYFTQVDLSTARRQCTLLPSDFFLDTVRSLLCLLCTVKNCPTDAYKPRI